MAEHCYSLSVRVSACGVVGREDQVSSGALVVSSLFTVQGNLGRHLRLHGSMQALQSIRQTSVKVQAWRLTQASIEHLAVKRVPELVL